MTVAPILNPETFSDDIQIDVNDLNTAFCDQAALYAHYSQLLFEAQKQASSKKMMMELKESVLDKQIRDRAATEGSKITEKSIETEIKRSKDYIAAKIECNEAEALESLIKNALRAFDQRKDMLISLGATQREERKGELMMSGVSSSALRGIGLGALSASPAGYGLMSNTLGK